MERVARYDHILTLVHRLPKLDIVTNYKRSKLPNNKEYLFLKSVPKFIRVLESHFCLTSNKRSKVDKTFVRNLVYDKSGNVKSDLNLSKKYLWIHAFDAEHENTLWFIYISVRNDTLRLIFRTGKQKWVKYGNIALSYGSGFNLVITLAPSAVH